MACNHRPPCLLAFFFFAAIASAQLSSTFYSTSCPLAIQTIRQAVRAAVAKEARMGASLLRLHFHDCFVNGCDGSVLLDDTPSFTGEKTAVPNNNSLRGFDVIDNIKSQVEAVCKQVVSCADILAVAARESVAADAANTEIPSPKSDLDDLISAYSKKGLSTTDMVALSGAHTIGQARCISFRDRIYNETSIDSSLATSRQSNCPSSGGGDDNLSPLDAVTCTLFDNFYFRNLVKKKGLLHSDQQLFGGGSTDSLVTTYSTNTARFFSDFAAAMVKMGNISPLTGTDGEVRLNCRKTN
ncbi:Peroxidase [Musa troglodytarum]|uniref:Peroxidase n=1 Tax=Musa troglodytarum TaxID=320322 RepID=A0A9E7L375_9LILI|nr:Peroxidase [Musa troglodytarum]